MTTTDINSDSAAARFLRSPRAIRERCGHIYQAASAGQLEHFSLFPERLDATSDYVLDTIRQNYPDLNIPYHSRWRHFSAGGVDRWNELSAEIDADDPRERGRIATELVILSVLLDAGAGEQWQYLDVDGQRYARSEGLAVASIALYRNGAFSAHPEQPLRADADALQSINETELARGLQAGKDNPLAGLSGRCELLRRLGTALRDRPQAFANARLGGLFDYLLERSADGALPAADILHAVLDQLGDIWPGRLTLGGVNLGDVWAHPAAGGSGPGAGLVAFHKLSQWLSYSLVEPLEWAGIRVTDLDELTGLPEYRNGGLFLDLGVLRLNDPDLAAQALTAGDQAVVEWRALTVMLLDQLAPRLRTRLDLNAGEFPLAKVLEGGSWSAGRRIARERRADGSPPLRLISDGTVF